MFLKKIKSQGISHLSYILGDKGMAAVIDPRRDCEVYLEIAGRNGCRITHIFETHRNEDYVIGSKELAALTGARIFHGEELPFGYGGTTGEGDVFELGDIRLRTLKTPGHTFESISLVLYDINYGEDPLGVFTGDALFIGDVGRTDFFPDQKEKMAELLYDSIFNKILPLGDQVILYPAHGAGSVCGSAMADREFSTLGYERQNNPMLKLRDKDEFIKVKASEKHAKPPYFSKMEEYNLTGPPAMGCFHPLKPMSARDFDEKINKGLQILDIRSAQAYAGVHVPGSIAVPLDMVPLYAGWFLSYQQDIAIIPESLDDLEPIFRYLARTGFDRIAGYLHGGLGEWEIQGRYFQSIPAVYAGEIQRRISEKSDFTLLDIRTEREFKNAHLPGAQHIFLGELENRMNEISPKRPITTFCGSGQRAIIAASILKKHGFREVENCFGSIQACSRGVCEIVSLKD
jgi:hydroxyacylglutathione hydrolase